MIGLPPLERDSSAQEIHLPADSAIELVADRVGADLPGQIDLHCGVDRHHIVIAGDESGIVGVGRGMKLEDGIVVDKLKQALGAQRESQNDLARLEVFPRSGQDARFNQRDHAVRYQFAVNGQIFPVHQQGQYRIGDSADAGLQNRAIFNQAGNVARDCDLQVGDHRLLQGAQRPRRLDESIDIVDMNEAVAVGARHVVVDLRHDVLAHIWRR